jgi:serine/threonine protein kinase
VEARRGRGDSRHAADEVEGSGCGGVCLVLERGADREHLSTLSHPEPAYTPRTMHLAVGTRLGPYDILAQLGAGGMGEVYRARDTRLDRDVAIKILPDVFASDPDRLMRFTREAKTLAALNHPNIAHIHGLEQSPSTGSGQGPVHALVMELVEGEDLAQRIARGPIPLDEALPIARQIAEALEAAHEAGIIHRDLKPANIKVRPDGTVKVLDFGLAKAMEPATGLPPDAEHSPTFTSPALTRMGVILGTAAYMAPEQAKGRVVDRRADVWAFGVVLFEMLTGRRAFEGEDVSDTLATVLKSDPVWERLPADTPPAIRRLLKRCLAKDPKLRLRDCGSALLDIRDAESGEDRPAADSQPLPARRAQRSVLPRAAIVLLSLATLGLAGVSSWALLLRPAAPAPAVQRLSVPLRPGDVLPRGSGDLLALSPDGGTLLYRAQRDGVFSIFRRPLDQFASTLVPGTEGTRDVFVSADAQWVGLWDNQVLKKLPASGGVPQMIAQLAGSLRGIEWRPDGHIVASSNEEGGPLVEIPPSGGQPVPLFTPAAGARAWYPQTLRAGKTILFTLVSDLRASGDLHLLDLASGATTLLLEDATAGRVLPSGHLVFQRDAALWAVPFDLDRLEVRGTPAPVVEGVRVEGGGAVQYAVSAGGTLAYISTVPGREAARPLVWLTRDGRHVPLPAPPREYIAATLSPDGTRVALGTTTADAKLPAGADIWVSEVERGTLTRITSNGRSFDPVWSPDGRSLVFTTVENGRPQLVRRSADGSGETVVIGTFEPEVRTAVAGAWLRDGSLVVTVGTAAGDDIRVMPADGSAPGRPLVATPADEYMPAVSRDGRWLAYVSNETGQSQVYVQPLTNSDGSRVQVPGMGHSPIWSANGTELLFQRGGPPTEVMRVAVRVGREPGTLTLGNPEVLADFRYFARRAPTRQYDATRSGDRLLFIGSGVEDGEHDRQIRVVINWFEELRRLVPVR